MKKYFLELTTILVALALSAFTMPPKIIGFQFRIISLGPSFNYSQAYVNNPDNWFYDESYSCSSGDNIPCTIIVLDESLIHEDPNTLELKLNNHDYVINTPDAFDYEAFIPAAVGAPVTD